MERLYFIVNPVAGAGRSEKSFGEIRSMLDARGMDYGFALSEYSGHALELARAALAAGERTIVACGGDGTVSEVASVLCGSGAVMGILPFGTGNDLARTLGLPATPQAALEVLLAGRIRPLDMGKANDRYFINAAGYGFDVDVLSRVEKHKGRFNGMLPYLLGIVQALFCLRRLRLTIRRPGQEVLETNAFIIVIGNGQYLGGGMRSTPQADPFDGQLDICLVRSMPFYRFLPTIVRFVKGTHLSLPFVDYYRAAEVAVDCSAGGPLDLDGELVGGVPVTFQVVAGALPLLVNP